MHCHSTVLPQIIGQFIYSHRTVLPLILWQCTYSVTVLSTSNLVTVHILCHSTVLCSYHDTLHTVTVLLYHNGVVYIQSQNLTTSNVVIVHILCDSSVLHIILWQYSYSVTVLFYTQQFMHCQSIVLQPIMGQFIYSHRIILSLILWQCTYSVTLLFYAQNHDISYTVTVLFYRK